MKKYFSKSHGFTLIELMIVIAIIAILTAVILASIYGARGKARDAKRVSDIAQIQLALEQYFDKCQIYPSGSTLTTSSSNTSCPGVTLGNFISVIPTSPSPGTYGYAGPAGNLDYIMHATLENPGNPAIIDGLTYATTDSLNYGSFVCQPTVKDYCVGPK